MASVTKIGKGKQPPRAIDFIDPMDGKRKRIRLGVTTQDSAVEACRRIDRLISAKTLNQSIQPEDAVWLRGLPFTIHERIADKGLCPHREPPTKAPKLAEWTAKYIAQRSSEITESSADRLRQTADRLVAYFGDVAIDAITPSQAADWRAAMTEGLAEATVRLHVRNTKSMFNAALDRELVTRNPFAKLKSSAIAAEREREVTLDETARLLEAAPSLQWRLLLGLARYAGLRVSSESHRLEWSDVDWERRRMRVYGKKTKVARLVPIVPALMKLLEEAFHVAPAGATKVITLSHNNLHRDCNVIVRRSGVTEWEDLFQALRRSCESDLAKRHPQHAVSKWLGHSMKVSEKHYLMVGDDLFDAAADDPVMLPATITSTIESKTTTTIVSSAESAAVFSTHAVANLRNTSEPPTDEFGEDKEKLADCRDTRQTASVCEVDRGGIEPPTPGFSVGLSSHPDSLLTSDNLSGCDSSGNGDESGAQQKAQHFGGSSALNDPRLARLIEVWPMLSEETRDAITRLTGISPDDRNHSMAPAGEEVPR